MRTLHRFFRWALVVLCIGGIMACQLVPESKLTNIFDTTYNPSGNGISPSPLVTTEPGVTPDVSPEVTPDVIPTNTPDPTPTPYLTPLPTNLTGFKPFAPTSGVQPDLNCNFWIATEYNGNATVTITTEGMKIYKTGDWGLIGVNRSVNTTGTGLSFDTPWSTTALTKITLAIRGTVNNPGSNVSVFVQRESNAFPQLTDNRKLSAYGVTSLSSSAWTNVTINLSGLNMQGLTDCLAVLIDTGATVNTWVEIKDVTYWDDQNNQIYIAPNP